MRVGIVGSRDYVNFDLVERVVRRLVKVDPDVVIISGGAEGVDRTAAYAARRFTKHEPVIYLPDWEGLGKRAGFIRNQTIVNDIDRLVAIWDLRSRGGSRGTLDTVDKALLADKEVFFYDVVANRWISRAYEIQRVVDRSLHPERVRFLGDSRVESRWVERRRRGGHAP